MIPLSLCAILLARDPSPGYLGPQDQQGGPTPTTVAAVALPDGREIVLPAAAVLQFVEGDVTRSTAKEFLEEHVVAGVPHSHSALLLAADASPHRLASSFLSLLAAIASGSGLPASICTLGESPSEEIYDMPATLARNYLSHLEWTQEEVSAAAIVLQACRTTEIGAAELVAVFPQDLTQSVVLAASKCSFDPNIVAFSVEDVIRSGDHVYEPLAMDLLPALSMIEGAPRHIYLRYGDVATALYQQVSSRYLLDPNADPILVKQVRQRLDQ